MNEEQDGGSFNYNEEDLKIVETEEVADDGLMPALEAIANLLKMDDLSGTLGELHTYLSEALGKTQDEQKAAFIAKTLQELSAYILSWEYADETYEKALLLTCKKLLDGKMPSAKFESIDPATVNQFFEKALALEPELAGQIKERMKHADTEEELDE